MRKNVLSFEEFVNENYGFEKEDYTGLDNLVKENQKKVPNVEALLQKIKEFPRLKNYKDDDEVYTLKKVMATADGIFYVDNEENEDAPILFYNYDGSLTDIVDSMTHYASHLYEETCDLKFIWISQDWKYNVNEILKEQGTL